MYNEDDIDKLIQPVVDRQTEVNTFVIRKIAQRINEIGKLLPSDVNSLEQLAKTGADVRVINKMLAEMTQLQLANIKKIIQQAAGNIYKAARPFFDYRQKPFIPFKENEQVQRVVKAIQKITSGEYKNMAKAQAFMLRDPKNPNVLKPTPIARAYQNIVDKAIQAVKSNVMDYQTTMRQTLKELIDSGIKTVTYDTKTGRRFSQRMDTAVRRNLLDGVRAVNQGVQDEVGKQFGADGVEISVHQCPAPDHQFVQGHQFYLSEWAKMAPVATIKKGGKIDNSVYEENTDTIYDVDGKAYEPFRRRIGTWNCRHFAWNIIVGHAPRNYSDKDLKKILDDNEKGVDIDGKHYTQYEATQMQRELETRIRQAKEAQIAAREAGDLDLALKYQNKADQLLHEYEDFSNEAGLRVKYDRIRVHGYRRIKR